MNCRIADVSVVRYPVLRITFSDGLSGEYDLSEMIASGAMFAPLRDEAFFAHVTVGSEGHTFGWNLDEVGHEIDFCPDATRIHIEEQKVAELANRYRATATAASREMVVGAGMVDTAKVARGQISPEGR
ncbi:MAG: DUF2442 domain-containing protein [Rhodopseudomonas palustris]|uniref:DUF2442 domain-containing protein n=1 Tax=Rhodopseudomonas palustris TaxID=1076 RepID=A0A933S1M8_RHOPL|nr:DUF2442 domain-containing protein [Rhodopseudomonas palustris]